MVASDVKSLAVVAIPTTSPVKVPAKPPPAVAIPVILIPVPTKDWEVILPVEPRPMVVGNLSLSRTGR